jgi:hypothetical protein
VIEKCFESDALVKIQLMLPMAEVFEHLGHLGAELGHNAELRDQVLQKHQLFICGKVRGGIAVAVLGIGVMVAIEGWFSHILSRSILCLRQCDQISPRRSPHGCVVLRAGLGRGTQPSPFG